MKKIELTPEWLLENFHHTACTSDDFKSISYVTTDDYWWMKLGADALEIPYEEEENWLEDENGNYAGCDIVFTFKIEDLKEVCPNMYKKASELAESNRKLRLEREN